MIRKFPKEVEDFAAAFVLLQGKRHQADYDPLARFAKAAVQTDRYLAEEAIAKFLSVGIRDRRAFCAYALLKKRKD